jgi:glycosyltransferase involved in cell wall biosynthesis
MAGGEGQAAGAGWIAQARSAQEATLPTGTFTVTCPARLGQGGLGRHLEEIIQALSRLHLASTCICGSNVPPPPSSAYRRLRRRALRAVLSPPPLRLAAAQRVLDLSAEFDSQATRQLRTADHLIAFNGVALEQIRAARRAGWESTSIVSATSHFRTVVRQHARAHRAYPLEGSWASRVSKRNLSEYALADRIYVSSEYARQSFLAEGFSQETLALFPLTPHPRFHGEDVRRDSSTFDIVYAGSLTVVKGVPLLIDAVRALSHRDIRLRLVGGWNSRGMRRFVQSACASDPRIVVTHGDPLPHLHAARLYVHPSYNDGFGYSPAEAVACSVPVIVSEDTGMKDLLGADGRPGVVVPTGDLAALTAAIDAAYRGELFGGGLRR